VSGWRAWCSGSQPSLLATRLTSAVVRAAVRACFRWEARLDDKQVVLADGTPLAPDTILR
jgi:hypothetical protein